MKFRKYQFLPQDWATLQADLQVEHEGGKHYNQDIILSVVEIGQIVTDEIPSKFYSVDIIWTEQELESFVPFQIWCEPVGIHSFGASIDADYIEAYNEQKG